MVSYQKSEYSDLYLITSKPETSIKESINKFISFSMMIGILMLLITGALIFKLTDTMLHPLKKLSYEMANFSNSNIKKRYEVKTSDETGVLISSFNHMMDMIDELIELKYKNKVKLQESQMKQQKMSLLFLKNQINQHFLYNTLDTIRIKAELNQDTDVSYMIMQLVNFFRLSTKVDNQIVTIEHELNLMQAYLKLICCRYPNVQSEYRIDNSLLDVMIPNFLLQPLVENSLMHGLKNQGYMGKIVLSVHRNKENEKYIEINLYDNGVGLSDDDYIQLEKMLAELKVDFWSKDDNGDNHIGIMNVQQRLKMYYTSECGLRYYRNEEGGITASILIKDKIDYMT
jgi:sensor histidine kinase YesM